MIRKYLEKYKELPRPIKASIWFVICGVLKDSIDVLATPIFTRILTTEQYGYYNAYNSWFQIVKIILTLYLYSDVFNVGLSRFDKDRDHFISSTLGFITTLVGAYFVLFLLFRPFILRIFGLPEFLAILLFFHVLIYVPYYCWIRKERFDYHFELVVLVSLLYIILQPLLGIVSILYFRLPTDPGYTRVIAAVGVQAIIGIILYAKMMYKGKQFFNKRYWKYSIKTGTELVPYNLSKVVLNQSDRLMIQHFFGFGATAVYSVAHSAAFVMQVVTEAVNGSFVPWLYRKLKNKDYSGINKIINRLIVLIAIAIVIVDLVAPEIMQVLAKKEYYVGVNCIPSLVFSVYLIFVYSLFTNTELFYGKNIGVTLISIVGTVANLLLNSVFIPQFGFLAAGYTTMTSYLIICIGHYLLLSHSLSMMQINMHDLFDTRTIMALSLFMFIFTLTCTFLYRWTWVRWGIVLLLLCVIYLLRRWWLSLLVRFKENS